jgi:hypothetical protein
MERAPDLTLALADGGLVSILPSEQLFSARPEVAGSHRPLGVFLAKGPGVRRGADAGELSLLDVAPALLYRLGLPIPENLEGRVPEGVFEMETLKQKPVTVGKVAEAVKPPGGPEEAPAPAFGKEEEAAVMRRLQELGYVE